MTARKLTEKQQLVLDARKELVALAKGGDAEARADLLRLHGMRVYRLRRSGCLRSCRVCCEPVACGSWMLIGCLLA